MYSLRRTEIAFYFLSSFLPCSQRRYSVFSLFFFPFSPFIVFLFRNENVEQTFRGRNQRRKTKHVTLLSLSLSLFLSLSLSLVQRYFSFLRRWNKYVLKKRTLYFYKRNTYYMYTYIHIFNYPTYSTYN